MAASIKRIRTPSSPNETPPVPEFNAKDVEEEQAMTTPVPFPGLLEIQSGIASPSNSPRNIDVETLLEMLQKDPLSNFDPAVSAQMAVEFFATDAIYALSILQSMPRIYAPVVQSYFQWEAAAAEHVTELSYDIDLDSDMTIKRTESPLQRFLPLCTHLRALKLNIRGRFAEGNIMNSSVGSILKKLPAQVSQLALFLDLNQCSADCQFKFTSIFMPLMEKLISQQQLCAIDLDITSDIDWYEMTHEIPNLIRMHLRPFQLKILARDPEGEESSLYQFKSLEGQEWQACAELYNEIVADPEQTQSYSLLIANKLFPKSGQLAPTWIGIEGQNGELISWMKADPLEIMLPIDCSIKKRGVVWCESEFPAPPSPPQKASSQDTNSLL